MRLGVWSWFRIRDFGLDRNALKIGGFASKWIEGEADFSKKLQQVLFEVTLFSNHSGDCLNWVLRPCRFRNRRADYPQF